MMLKRVGAGFLAIGGLTATSFGSLVNASFEDPPVGQGNYTQNGAINGWSVSGADAGVWYILPTGLWTVLAPNGNQIGYANGNSVAQQSTDVIGPGTNTISIMGGRRADGFDGSFSFELWSGGVVAGGNVTGGTLLASVLYDRFVETPGQFAPRTTSYVAGSNDPHIGELISVRMLRTDGAQMNFDDVRVSTPVPEPAALSVLGLGALAILRRHSKSRM